MHVIRLRKPWDKWTPQAPQRQRVDVPEPPSSEASGSTASPVIYQRRFNRPTGLAAGTAVVLRITGWSGELASLSLNDQALAVGPAPLEIDLTGRLEPHNRLQLTLAAEPGTAPRLSGEVTLAIAE